MAQGIGQRRLFDDHTTGERAPLGFVKFGFAALAGCEALEWQECEVGRWRWWKAAVTGSRFMRLLELDVPRTKVPIVRFTIVREDQSAVATGLVGLYHRVVDWSVRRLSTYT